MADDLRKLAIAATSGPWFAEAPPAAVSDYDACRSQYHAVVTRGCCIADDALPRDAAYIAAAHPQAVLALLARIEQAEQDAARYRERLADGYEAGTCIVDAGSWKVSLYYANPEQAERAFDAITDAINAALSPPGAAAAGGTGAAAVSGETPRLDPNLVRIERLEAALTELVACKELKERIEKMDAERSAGRPSDVHRKAKWHAENEYEHRKPLAWAAARALCNADRKET